MNYDQQITLEQALDLQNKIKSGEMPDIIAFSTNARINNSLENTDVNYVYKNRGKELLLTRSDYATYILGNNPLPDGYGYPSKDLSIGIYDELPYYFNFNADDWSKNLSFDSNYTTVKKWYQICFRLTDLARVEAESVVSKMERTEINAAQVEYLVKNEVKTKLFYQCGDEVVEQIRFWINDIEAAKNGTVFSLLTTDYNSLPDEFKALADKPFAEKYKETLAKPKPSMPAHFEADWKEAKYKELEKQLLEATALAETRQARINELEATLQIQLKHIEILENQNSELSIKCSKLSQYAITNLLNSL